MLQGADRNAKEGWEDPHLDVRLTLQRLPFYCTPPAVAYAVIPDPTPRDLAVGTPSSKIVAKAEASQKRKASTSGATLSYVAKRTRSALAQSFGSTTRPSLFVGDDDESDDDACFPTSRDMVRVESLPDNQLTMKMSVLYCMLISHGSELLARYCRLNQYHHEYVLSIDYKLKGYKEKVANMTGLELQVSALKKQGRKKKIKSLTKSLDDLHTEVAHLSVALNQASILEVERDVEILQLKATPSEFSSFFRGQFQGLVQKLLASDEFSRVQGELPSLAASAGFERGLSMHWTKDEFAVVLKKMVNFMPGTHDRLVEASPLVAQTEYAFLNKISEHSTKPLSVSTMTPVSKSLELSANVDFIAFVVASEHNEEMINAKVDGSDPKMTDDTITAKSEHAFVQGMSIILDAVVELVGVGSGRVSSCPNDVMVALSAGEKGDGLDPSSVASEEAAVNPFGMEILLEPTSNKLMVERFNTTTGNPVKDILLKLNLPDHKSILMDSKVYIKMDMEVPGSSRLTRFIATCSYSTDIYKDIMKAQVHVSRLPLFLYHMSFLKRESVKVKELQERCVIKAFKLSYQEQYEHIGPEVTRSQDGKITR
nr:hypothetical protein [Tanacetum cinerariifolium]